MAQSRILEETSSRIREILAASPASDVERNLRVMLAGVFDKLQLATREELEIQQQVLARTREKVAALEARIAKLETDSRRP